MRTHTMIDNVKARASSLLLGALIAAFAAGCATGPAVKDTKGGAQAQSRTKIYLEGYSVAVAHESFGQSCSPAKSKLDWKELIARANACVAKKDWNTLELVANDLAKGDADSPWGSYFLSLAAEGRSDWPRAMWMIDLAAKKAGNLGLFSYQRGRIWVGLGETSQGIAEIQKAVAAEPKLLDGQLYLAEIFARDLDLKKAVTHFKAVLAAQPGHRRAQAGLAEVRVAEAGESDPEACAIYQELKAALDAGNIKEKNDPELVARIKYLATTVKPVVAAPAPAVAAKPASVEKVDKAPASVGAKKGGGK